MPHTERFPLVATTAHDPGEIIAAALDQAETRDPTHARTWIVLVEGDYDQIDAIDAEPARHGIDVHIVIDLSM
ncbi:hypothetical protein ACFYXQ_46455 [Nocardia jiangxiensis]|uniref:Uncharacterized protein n=2 Tax=Nocardia jiangxiensis TaxID=282685 RepID=A0ABW6SG51_9NOCA